MNEIIICPECKSDFTYEQEDMMVCSQCFHEWNPVEAEEAIVAAANKAKIFDSNNNELQNGDSVIVIKDLPVKGAQKPIKAGTKVKNIKLNFESDHNIDCKIDGFGAMGLKSEFVRKA